MSLRIRHFLWFTLLLFVWLSLKTLLSTNNVKSYKDAEKNVSGLPKTGSSTWIATRKAFDEREKIQQKQQQEAKKIPAGDGDGIVVGVGGGGEEELPEVKNKIRKLYSER